MRTIQLIMAGTLSDEEIRAVVPTWVRGGYVREYDPTIGLPSLVVTADRALALRLESVEAFRLWRSVQKSQPVRPWDGKPNRPLTAFTVSIDKVDA